MGPSVIVSSSPSPSRFPPVRLCQQYCTVQQLFDKKREKKTGLLGPQRSLFKSRLRTHSFTECHTRTVYFSTYPVYTCTVLLVCPVVDLFFACVSVWSHCEEVQRCHEQKLGGRPTTHISIATAPPPPVPPPVNMNVTCISCIYTIEIQHISPLYTLYPLVHVHGN